MTEAYLNEHETHMLGYPEERNMTEAWQPIETFEKEENQFVKILTYDGDGDVALSCWFRDLDGEGVWEGTDGVSSFYVNPTHWMPLPTPPTGEKP